MEECVLKVHQGAQCGGMNMKAMQMLGVLLVVEVRCSPPHPAESVCQGSGDEGHMHSAQADTLEHLHETCMWQSVSA